jgi:tRNA G46 methylase TrmB
MKKILNTASTVYRVNQAALESFFSPDARVLFVDIGCGPATACLALADLLKNRTFGYVGIDAAMPMQNKALTLWQAAQSMSLIGTESTAHFAPSWEEIDLGQLQEDIHYRVTT